MRTPGTRNGQPLAHFWEHLHDGGEDCYAWPFHTAKGYGCLTIEGRRKRVHVFALELTVGPCPPGQQARHSCRNPSCWNPAHLSWGTPVENMADRDRHGTTRRGEEHGRAKLTWREVEEIRWSYSQHLATQQALADIYGVSQQVISRIICGKTWVKV